jgi:hypothetical protein
LSFICSVKLKPMTSAGLHRFYAPFSLNPGIPAFRSANTPVKRSNPITLFVPSSLGCCISSLKYRHEVKCGSDSGKNCLNSLQSCSDSLKKCFNSLKKCSNSVQKCSDSVQKCFNSVQKCSNSVQKCSNSVQKCFNSVQSCSDFVQSQRLFNKQYQVITYCTFILNVSYLK